MINTISSRYLLKIIVVNKTNILFNLQPREEHLENYLVVRFVLSFERRVNL